MSCLLPTACGPAQKTPVPTDFKLSARFSPGYSDWKPWKTVITADGTVSQEVEFPRSGSGRGGTTRSTLLLTTNDLQQLVSAVRASSFSTLKTNYSQPVTDNPTLSLELTISGSSNKVVVYAPGLQKDNGDVKRFLKVWNEVLKKVPSPNPGQQPEYP